MGQHVVKVVKELEGVGPYVLDPRDVAEYVRRSGTRRPLRGDLVRSVHIGLMGLRVENPKESDVLESKVLGLDLTRSS